MVAIVRKNGIICNFRNTVSLTDTVILLPPARHLEEGRGARGQFKQ